MKKTAEGLKILNLKIPKCYIKPKIHTKKNNPGRVTINPINCRTSEIWHFAEYYLQPAVKKIPSYIIDTTDFVKKINNLNTPKNLILITMDVWIYQHSKS